MGTTFSALVAVILVSFGTSYDDSRAKTIDSLERTVAERYASSGVVVQSAFTSEIIRKKLDARGIHYDSLDAALDKALARGVKKVVIQPTHLMFGYEYTELRGLALPYEKKFEALSYGEPLLADSKDISAMLDSLKAEIPLQKKEALVLMGHGTEHFANFLYAAADYQAKAQGFPHVFVGTVESYPGVDEALAAVKKAGYKKACLAPMMLVAGDHANNDMAGDEDDSWKSIFEKAGVKTRAVLRGMGEFEGVRQIYLRHIEEAMAGLEK